MPRIGDGVGVESPDSIDVGSVMSRRRTRRHPRRAMIPGRQLRKVSTTALLQQMTALLCLTGMIASSHNRAVFDIAIVLPLLQRRCGHAGRRAGGGGAGPRVD